jgi:hypothetical protein
LAVVIVLVEWAVRDLGQSEVYGGGEAGFPKNFFFGKIKTQNLELIIFKKKE